ncbi:MAG: hypothetical protein K8W52_45755 [Deltaproteobacteria bacterium]|nr:hypothetical protein [Deltaproteobacteria bacterium]
MRKVRAFTGAWLAGALTIACSGGDRLEVRDDLAPIGRRIELPCAAASASWVAVPVFEQDRLLETPDKPYTLFAVLDATCPPSTGVDALTLPASVADLLLPLALRARCLPEADGCRLTGRALPAPVAARSDDVTAQGIAIDGRVVVVMHLFSQ